MFNNPDHRRTPFIRLDTKKCMSCWACVAECANRVIGKVDILWHKHAVIADPDNCTGCLSCVSVCQYGAYSIRKEEMPETKKLSRSAFNNFLINNLLLIAGFAAAFSGLALQLGFHMGGPDTDLAGVHEAQFHSMQYEQLRQIDTNRIVCGFNYAGWSALHKFVIVSFVALIIFHTYVHWKWYKGVIKKRLIGRNSQAIILSVLFLFAAVTGLTPWFIDLSGGGGIPRMFFIEIHDKLTLILIVFLVLHFIKRAKWFAKAYAKLKTEKP